jgi:hypothetical protein
LELDTTLQEAVDSSFVLPCSRFRRGVAIGVMCARSHRRAVYASQTSAAEARQGHSCDALEVKSSTDNADGGRSFADLKFLQLAFGGQADNAGTFERDRRGNSNKPLEHGAKMGTI